MELEKIRKQVDKIDEQIVLLLARRLELIPAVAKYKTENNLERVQGNREQEILTRLKQIGKENKLDEDYIKDIFNRIIKESHKVEKKIMGK